MSIVKQQFRVLVVAAMAVLIGAAGATHAADKAAPAATSGEFDGANFICLNYTNGLGENSSTKMQSTLGRLWMEGYLAGLYKGQGKLEFSDDKQDAETLSALFLQRCRDYPSYTILSVAGQTIGKDPHKMPSKSVAEFAPATYTCAQHVDARAAGGAEATRADLAELWAFAFIQGFKNATAPNMVIPIENKPVLIGIVNKHCATERETLFVDMTAKIADKVKLQ